MVTKIVVYRLKRVWAAKDSNRDDDVDGCDAKDHNFKGCLK